MLSASAESEDLPEEVSKAVLELTAEALVMLNAFREREGAATAREMRQRCENIRGLVERMEKIREGAIPAFQKRLRESWPNSFTAPASTPSAWRRKPPCWPTAATSPKNWSACAPTAGQFKPC